MIKSLIAKISASVIAFLAALMFFVGLLFFGSEGGNYAFLITFASLSSIVFIVLILLDRVISKIFVMIPVFVSYVCIFILTSIYSALVNSISNGLGSSVSGANILNSEIMSLLIMALFIVATIFALKKKRWATIIMFVLLGINLLSIFQGIYMNILMGQNMELDSYRELDGFLYTYIAIGMFDVALITYLAGNQYIKNNK